LKVLVSERQLRKKLPYLITVHLIVGSLIIPAVGLLSSSQNILSKGMILYSKHELGVFYVKESVLAIPNEASWVVAAYPNYIKPRENLSVILNWYDLHPPSMIKTEAELKSIEEGLKSVPIENFWGIFFIAEEHYRTHIAFYDAVNTTWFGEKLLGYPLYLKGNPSTTRDQWKDEMYLRMIRGFYNYFHPKTKVGITAPAGSVIANYRDLSWLGGIPYCFGEPAMAFIRERYDFVFLYGYAVNLEDFNEWFKPYFSLTDQLFSMQKKFWILTRIWDEPPPWGNVDVWEKEAIALEMKNCLGRNMVITSYYWNNPPLKETWALMLKAVELYNREAPYFENYVYGENLLTGYVGDTYGWVEV
jgi:hypothetical protein